MKLTDREWKEFFIGGKEGIFVFFMSVFLIKRVAMHFQHCNRDDFNF